MTEPSAYTRSLDRSEIVGIVGFAFIATGIGGGSVVLANVLHIDDGDAFAVLGGVALTLAAIFRPWPFWWHAKALLVRSVFGDRGATALYLLLGLGSVTWGSLRIRDWSHDAATCRQLFEQARNSQERIQALRHIPRPGMSDAPGHESLNAWTCARYRDFAGF